MTVRELLKTVDCGWVTVLERATRHCDRVVAKGKTITDESVLGRVVRYSYDKADVVYGTALIVGV